jgi:hypothetical protein
VTTGRGGALARLGGLVAVALLALLLPAAAASASAYRYWGYWHGTSSGGWTFSPVGATYVPAAGAVEGWRFGVSAVAGTLRPRTSSTFGSICAGRTASAGHELVGLVVDYGTAVDAPPGETPPRGIDTYCADVPVGANAYEVVHAYASVRTDSGLVCGIDGYPRTECGVPVQAGPAPTPTATARPAPPPPSAARPGPTTASAPTTGGSAPTHQAAPAGATATTGAVATPATRSAPSATTPEAMALPPGSPSSPTATAVAAGGLGDGGGTDGGGSGLPAGALVGGALVLAVSGAALWRASRRAAGT